MLMQYITSAMRQAHYEFLKVDKKFYGEIPKCRGVYATGKTLEECREQLEEVLEEWLLFRISKHLSIPLISCLMMILYSNAALACKMDPLIYKLKDNLVIEASANREIIFEGKKKAPWVTQIKTEKGEDFSALKVERGIKLWNDKTGDWQRYKNGTRFLIDEYKGLTFPVTLLLEVEDELGKKYQVKIIYGQPAFYRC